MMAPLGALHPGSGHAGGAAPSSDRASPVSPSSRLAGRGVWVGSGGVGRQLLDHVKTSRWQLRLQVYRKNLRAAAFYRREGFRVLEEGVDPETGEAELLMEWRWDGPQS